MPIRNSGRREGRGIFTRISPSPPSLLLQHSRSARFGSKGHAKNPSVSQISCGGRLKALTVKVALGSCGACV